MNNMRKIKFMVMMSELGAGTRGASTGFKALETAALNKNNHLFNRYPLEHIPVKNEKLYEKIETPFGKHIEGIADLYEVMDRKVSKARNSGFFPVVISGDHSMAGGTIAGLKSSLGDGKLGVVWVDAHGDLHSPYTTPTGNVHGMPLATAIGDDNLDMQHNDVKGITKKHWERMKGPEPRVLPDNLVFVGVRDTEKEEDHLIQKHGIKNHTVAEVREKGAAEVAREILDQLSDCEGIYISFDVDSMDSSISVGTGTPVPNGLWKEEARELLTTLVRSPKIIGFEMVEVNSTLDDKGNVMAETAFDILNSVIEELFSEQ